MKELKELVRGFKGQQIKQPGAHNLQNSIPPIVKSLVDQVFKQLKIICPAYDHSLPTEQTVNDCKKEWVKAFFENDINNIEIIKLGLAGARRYKSDFLPSCGKFISWCAPSPESYGWPSTEEALKKCIEFRNDKKLFGNKAKYCRPMIIQLCSLVDWWLMNSANSQQSSKKADIHFCGVYMELFKSGYVEPQQTDSERLTTEDIINEGLSEQQLADKQKRGLNNIEKIKSEMKILRAKKYNKK